MRSFRNQWASLNSFFWKAQWRLQNLYIDQKSVSIAKHMVHLKTTKATNVTNIKMCHKKITSFIKNGFLKDWLFLKNLLLLKKSTWFPKLFHCSWNWNPVLISSSKIKPIRILTRRLQNHQYQYLKYIFI